MWKFRRLSQVPHGTTKFLLSSILIWTTSFSYAYIPLLGKLPKISSSVLSMKSADSVMSISSPQLLEFREPQTNVTVILLGSMHYNPISVGLAEDIIQELGQANKLGSVVVESCDIRWNKTGEINTVDPKMKKFLRSEMVSASDAASIFNRPVVLGDQRINITSVGLKDSVKQTFLDLANPVSGWKSFSDDVSNAFRVALPSGPEYLGPFAFFDLRLLSAAPVTFLKYPLAFFLSIPNLH